MSIQNPSVWQPANQGDIPRPEYPRPQFVRRDWLNLNGVWDFELDQGESGVERKVYQQDALKDHIVVPFCPESALSGVAHKDFIRGCWYLRTFTLPEAWRVGRVLINFGAVNYAARIYVNGAEAGTHEGGYVSFSLDITDFCTPGENRLMVYARSDLHSGKQPSGKQSDSYLSRGCSYTRTTGIWQTVWLEHTPEARLDSIRLTPDLENAAVRVDALALGGQGTLTAEARFEGKAVGQCEAHANGDVITLTVPLTETHPWEVGKPALYALTLKYTPDGGGEADTVESYFGLRTVQIKDSAITINGRPVYQRLVLDQGFNPEGVITAPSDAELRADIERSMAMGFNGARLHQKIFEPRFLYWADQLGYLVWGEHGNWGLDTSKDAALAYFLPEWLEAVARDMSSPALVGWCPFNETQTNTSMRVLKATYQATKRLDPSRPVIDTSGWVHCGETDVYDYHDYESDPDVLAEHLRQYVSAKPGEDFPDPSMPFAKRLNPVKTRKKGQPVMLSEFGGIAYFPNGAPKDTWGYGNALHTEEDFLKRFGGQVRAAMHTEGICGFCYTQLTDVEQECNGLYTYTREPKFAPEKIRAILTESENAQKPENR